MDSKPNDSTKIISPNPIIDQIKIHHQTVESKPDLGDLE